MTHINAVFAGKRLDLEMAEFWAIKFASIKKFKENKLFVTWICETEDYEQALEECMECVDMDRLREVEIERFG